MLKRLVNECRFTLTIHTTGPVLVRSGHETVSGPNMTPVRTYRNGKTEVYFPGSSLKGVFRSHIEKVIRTLNNGIICNPFVKLDDKALHHENNQLVCPDYTEVSCSDKFEVRQKDEVLKVGNVRWEHSKGNVSNEDVYQDSCPVCRLFGSTSFIGRVAISDAYLLNTEMTEQRDGVGIDRFTGGAANGAKFELEVVSSGVTFEADIYVRNFEGWQLGMLMLIVQDLEDELIRIGSGRSRGLGNVKGEISEVQINYIGMVNGKPTNGVWGLGKFLNDSPYGTETNDCFTVEPTNEQTSGIRKITTFRDDNLECLRQTAVEVFINKIQSWNVPEAMRFAYLQFQRVGGNR